MTPWQMHQSQAIFQEQSGGDQDNDREDVKGQNFRTALESNSKSVTSVL